MMKEFKITDIKTEVNTYIFLHSKSINNDIEINIPVCQISENEPYSL